MTDATTRGVDVGSESIVFEPNRVRGGEYAVDIGTAGSIPLVFDTVLPLQADISESLSARVIGGTDVKWAPPLDYVRYVKCPTLAPFGYDIEVEVSSRGFYPAGGGEATLVLETSTPESIHLEQRGSLEEVRIYSVASASLADADVAERQAESATTEVSKQVSVPIHTFEEYARSFSKGSSIVVVAVFENGRSGFSSLGEPGKPAETVGAEAVDRFEAFMDSEGAIDPHLADQLLSLLAVSGGSITTTKTTPHIRTAIDLLETFDVEVSLETDTDPVSITVDSPLPR
jgi:RNA 3'-terminal phosphate cyclase (ATP)